jgi:hypothetical protein
MLFNKINLFNYENKLPLQAEINFQHNKRPAFFPYYFEIKLLKIVRYPMRRCLKVFKC